MKTVPLNQIFHTSYGTKFDLNKMQLVDDDNAEGVNFVARTSKNLGVTGTVKKILNIEPYESGLITVALGGSILSSNIQPKPFYTAQNIVVLIPIETMSFNEKLFYCLCIEKNKDKYNAFGREANRTLKELLVPERIPEWVDKIIPEKYLKIDLPITQEKIFLDTETWKWFKYKNLFSIDRGKGERKYQLKGTKTPFVTSTDQNNGVTGYTDMPPLHDGHVITVARNGSVGEAFYQLHSFCSTEDVHIFTPRFNMNIYHAFFLIPLIKKEKYRYSFGRKWGIKRMNESLIKLPYIKSKKSEPEPDWNFIEKFIKSLPYSNAI